MTPEALRGSLETYAGYGVVYPGSYQKSSARGKEKVECFAALHLLVFPAKACYNKATKRRRWQVAGGCLKSCNLLQKPVLPIFSLPPLSLAKNLPLLFKQALAFGYEKRDIRSFWKSARSFLSKEELV